MMSEISDSLRPFKFVQGTENPSFSWYEYYFQSFFYKVGKSPRMKLLDTQEYRRYLYSLWALYYPWVNNR